ncbi:MAG: hypothetical protein L0H25_07575 [Micrococcales bacterium]|nr:hypothetical protein [Micrococcales bacterium]
MTEPTPAVNLTALLGEAMTKSGLFWIEAPGERARPAWHVWVDGTAYVVNGPGEQTLPWLPREVRIILRSKDTGSRLLTVRARTQILEPGSPAWKTAAEALRARRLNAVDDSLTRWAQSCTITALRPFDVPVESPGSYGADNLRALPAETPATTTSWRPWHWRGRGTQRRRR